jgi:hypothetical protein
MWTENDQGVLVLGAQIAGKALEQRALLRTQRSPRKGNHALDCKRRLPIAPVASDDIAEGVYGQDVQR